MTTREKILSCYDQGFSAAATVAKLRQAGIVVSEEYVLDIYEQEDDSSFLSNAPYDNGYL